MIYCIISDNKKKFITGITGKYTFSYTKMIEKLSFQSPNHLHLPCIPRRLACGFQVGE